MSRRKRTRRDKRAILPMLPTEPTETPAWQAFYKQHASPMTAEQYQRDAIADAQPTIEDRNGDRNY